MQNKKIKNFYPFNFIECKKGQLTIFIIIAIVLVVGVMGFFVLRENLFQTKLPANMEPIYTTFESCLEDDALTGAGILGIQAGYIYLPEFEPGSSYMPFSSQLDFLGTPVPYWYYVSGNNIQKEQVPSKKEMEKQLARFIEEKIRDCNFKNYYDEGFEIVMGEPKASVDINDENIKIKLNMDLRISKEEESVNVENHNIEINSKLGKLYDAARKIYDKEQKDLFLEEYAIDTLRLYAPVDGVEITCSPKVWVLNEVFDELQQGIEANTLALKTKNGDYSLTKEENKYFVTDISVDADVRFLNSRNWPYSFEVESDDNLLIAKPIGNQPGFGILGFCYVPYHFVYNLNYPVLIQVSDNNEIFQFPVAVVIQANNPREPLKGATAVGADLPELCKYKNTPMTINIYDTKMNPVNADISFKCFGTRCSIGRAEDGTLTAKFPQCENGYIFAKADGYEDAKYLQSTVDSGNIDIVMNKLYELNIELKLDGETYTGDAIITFTSDKGPKTIVYPEQSSIKLSEGEYEINVHIYKTGQLKLKKTTKEQCIEVPRGGLGGLIGLTREKCFDIEIPEQIISQVLIGGGKQKDYFLESQLENSNIIEIDAPSLATPKTIEQLQENYILFDSNKLDIILR